MGWGIGRTARVSSSRRRGEQMLPAALAAVPGAGAGWEAASESTRALYLEYVGAPWTRGTRRALARQTAVWAADGTLETYIRRPRPALDLLVEVVGGVVL